MNTVKVSVQLALAVAAAGVVFGGVQITLADSTPNAEPAKITVAVSDVMVNPETGRATMDVEFNEVAPGPFRVTASTLDDGGLVVEGFSVSADGEAPPPPPNMVLSPVAVQLTLGG